MRTLTGCAPGQVVWNLQENYKGKFSSISSTQEASKDREFITPSDSLSLNRDRNSPVVGCHSIARLAGHFAGVATRAVPSCLCAQTGETFYRKVASSVIPVDGHQKGCGPVRGVRLPESNPAGRKDPAVGVSRLRKGGCNQGSRDAEGVEGTKGTKPIG